MKYLFVVFSFLAVAGSTAQDCKHFNYLQNNKTIEMTIYSRKGDVAGKNVYNVTDVKASGGTSTSVVNSEMFDKKGKSITKSVINFKCTGGVMMVDMKMMIPQQQNQQFADAKAENVYIEYPSDMKPGDNLKDGNLAMEMNNSGMQQTLTLNVTSRKVEARESVTTPAGTWECFKISSKNRITVKMGPIGIPMNMEITEWYAPGFGVVKSDSKSGGTMITSVK